MPDISIGSTGWNSDLVLTPSGDLEIVDGSALGTQRVTRRLLTPVQALWFHPEYGAGLPQKIGSTINARSILGLVRTQIFQEAAVAQSPAPQIKVQDAYPGSGELVISVRYQDQNAGGPQLVQFDLTSG